MTGYITHKAVELDALSKKVLAGVDLTSTSYDWQPKFDGCNMVVTKHGNTIMLSSRTANKVHSAQHIAQALYYFPDGMYFGEYIIPSQPFPLISGAFRDTKEQHPDAVYVIFDLVQHSEYTSGTSAPWSVRKSRLDVLPTAPEIIKCPSGTRAEMEDWISNHPEFYYDGLIARLNTGVFIKGSSGKGGEILKVKKQNSLDLVLKEIHTSPGKVTKRPVYTLETEYQGMQVIVGSGVPHTKKDLPKVGSIIEVEFLGLLPSGALREPRYKGIRTDKINPDN